MKPFVRRWSHRPASGSDLCTKSQIQREKSEPAFGTVLLAFAGSVCWGTKAQGNVGKCNGGCIFCIVPCSSASHPPHSCIYRSRIVVESCPIVAILCPRRKDQNVLSPVNCWNLLLNQVKRESRDHTTLSDIYLNNIIPRFVQVSEDSGRLFKKVTECYSTELLLWFF